MQALAAAGDMLFSGGQDQSVRVWRLDPATNQWGCVAALLKEQGGHAAPVSSLWASHPFLFSADFLGTLKVRCRADGEGLSRQLGFSSWAALTGIACHRTRDPTHHSPGAPRPHRTTQVWDLTTGAVRQTLARAHSGSEVPCITDLTVWEGHIVSASLDGLIKIWEPADPASGNILNPTPIFTYPDQVGGAGGWHGVVVVAGRGGHGGDCACPAAACPCAVSRAHPRRLPCPLQEPGQRGDSGLSGILALCGVADAQVGQGLAVWCGEG